MRIGLVMAALLLTGCTQEAALKRQVAAALKDPASAKFGDIYLHFDDGQRTACGTVNARNGFGAYGGATPFMVKGGLLYIPVKSHCCRLTLVEERETTAVWHRECEAELPVPILLDR